MHTSDLITLIRGHATDPEAGHTGSWYYQLASQDTGLWSLDLANNPDHRLHVVHVAGNRCKTVSETCETLANALEFPTYYGRNLDAFDECIRDLLDLSEGTLGSMFGSPGRHAEGVVVMVDSANEFLTDESPNRAAVLIDLLAEAATNQTTATKASLVFAFNGTLAPSIQSLFTSRQP